nr:ArlX2 [Gefionella okellyi]
MGCITSKSVDIQPVLMAGLDAAGRTTLLFKLSMKSFTGQPSPTIGFNVETVKHHHVPLRFWDVGGASAVRQMWKHYLPASSCVYVVDSTDRKRLAESAKVYNDYLCTIVARNTPILVVVSKTDNSDGLSLSEVADALNLFSQTRPWYILGSSNVPGEGIDRILDWSASATQGFSDGTFSITDHGLFPTWSPQTNAQFPSEFRRVVKTLLLIAGKSRGAARYPQAGLGRLPKEVLYQIVARLAAVRYAPKKQLPRQLPMQDGRIPSAVEGVPENVRQKIGLLSAVDE